MATLDDLIALDEQAEKPLRALEHKGGSADDPGTLASPHRFVASDGRTYWVKRVAQNNFLAAELIAGRVGQLVAAAPSARLIEVPAAALPEDGSANHLQGVGVGIEHHPGTNIKQIHKLTGTGTYPPENLDASSRARVVAFQSYIAVGIGDAQLLIDEGTGKVVSLDHGDSLVVEQLRQPVALVVREIPGSPDVGRDLEHVDHAVGRIEALTDEDLLRAVAGVPAGDPWGAPPERRLEIATRLSSRRSEMKEVMARWTKT